MVIKQCAQKQNVDLTKYMQSLQYEWTALTEPLVYLAHSQNLQHVWSALTGPLA